MIVKITFLKVQNLILIVILINGTNLYAQYDQDFIKENRIKSIEISIKDYNVLFPGEIQRRSYGDYNYSLKNSDTTKPLFLEHNKFNSKQNFDRNGRWLWNFDFITNNENEALKAFLLKYYKNIGVIDKNGFIKKVYSELDWKFIVKTFIYDNNKLIREVDTFLIIEPISYYDSVLTKEKTYDYERKESYKITDTLSPEIINYKYDSLGRKIEKNSDNEMIIFNYYSDGSIKEKTIIKKVTKWHEIKTSGKNEFIKKIYWDTLRVHYSQNPDENLLLKAYFNAFPITVFDLSDFTAEETNSGNSKIKYLRYNIGYVTSYYNGSGRIRQLKLLTSGFDYSHKKICYNVFFKYKNGLVSKILFKIPNENIERYFNNLDNDETVFYNINKIKKWKTKTVSNYKYSFYSK